MDDLEDSEMLLDAPGIEQSHVRRPLRDCLRARVIFIQNPLLYILIWNYLSVKLQSS